MPNTAPDLIVYPGSRAIRDALQERLSEEGFLPRMLRMDDFERRLILVPGKRMVDPMQRIFYLREAAGFAEFERLKTRRELIRFFSSSRDFFRFFEELALEKVAVEELARADAYAEFAEHIGILETLRENYRRILEREGFTDRIFLPEEYRLNRAFLGSFERMELHLEGYPGRFELELLERVASEKECRIRLRSTRFNRKVLERLREMGIELPEEEGELLIDLHRKEVAAFDPRPLEVRARVLAVQERYDQVATALAEIQRMVESGIAPERIALILPDEKMSEIVALYDRLNNFNVAQGFAYSRQRGPSVLRALGEYWKSRESERLDFLESLGVDRQRLKALSSSAVTGLEDFFAGIEALGVPELPTPALLDRLEESAPLREKLPPLLHRFERLFGRERLTRAQWLHLWTEALEELRLDDVGGGRVTVMGVLETRGMRFDGVVLLDFNEGVVPASSGKDRFLDSRVRRFAGLPTRRDREALQKHYYARLMEKAQAVTLCYAEAENRLPSRFLYELGLEEGERIEAPRGLLYPHSTPEPSREDPRVEAFDPFARTWSPAMLRSWLRCRRSFYYRYIRGLREPEEEGLQEGRFLHRLLQEVYTQRHRYESEEALRDALARTMGELLPSSPENDYFRALWMRRLEGFVAEEIARFREGWRIEAVELTLDGMLEGLRFSGRADRLDVREGEALILDYKTGSTADANRKKDPQKITDFQLPIYRRLLRERYSEVDAAFIKILEGGALEYLTAPEEKEAQLTEFLGELAATREFVAERTEDLDRCRFCAYRLLCERGEYL
ncbi:PD-(D/E)XK nuclease family protein [Nitratifractor sp.]|uniref:PD-(D/E)XK nuclease family protein n=1 Tax=Nitratifractor sp. TaxID=2268144 RepID=UPI0025EC3582|nr:PD-(D/E)XK nuclease family protein [Nitratifractor sp.]